MNIFNSKADKDPSIFVLYEVVGMWISLFMLDDVCAGIFTLIICCQIVTI